MLLKANTWYYMTLINGTKQTVCYPRDIPPVKRTLASYDLKPGMKVKLDKRQNTYTVVAIFDRNIVFGHEGLPLIVAGLNDFYQVEFLGWL